MHFNGHPRLMTSNSMAWFFNVATHAPRHHSETHPTVGVPSVFHFGLLNESLASLPKKPILQESCSSWTSSAPRDYILADSSSYRSRQQSQPRIRLDFSSWRVDWLLVCYAGVCLLVRCFSETSRSLHCAAQVPRARSSFLLLHLHFLTRTR